MDKIPPLFFVDKTKPGFTDYEVCMAVIKIIDRGSLKGVQKVGALWRIYVDPTAERGKLAATGIDIGSKHVSLFTDNPFTSGTTDGQRPIKIYINGVRMSHTNECIEDYSKGLLKCKVNCSSEKL